LLAAMLPIVYSMSRGTPSTIPLDEQQSLELLLTLGQSLLSALFLIEMRLAWWEAAGLFGLWIVQFGFTTAVHDVIAAIYFVWALVEIARLLKQRRAPALSLFAEMWRKHVR